MNAPFEAVVSAGFGRGSEILLGFVLNRHKATMKTLVEGVEIRFPSLGDPQDLFDARFEDLMTDLSYYGFEVGHVLVNDQELTG